MRNRLTYANVISTLALVFAVGTGGAWAAKQINGSVLKARSISGTKVRTNTLTGRQIRESKLATVPRASNALRLGGKPASAYLTSAGTAANAANAANADKLGGIGAAGFVQGTGRLSAGRATGTGGADPNVFKTFATPIGEFRLGCGVANVDTRYFNTTTGDAEVFRSVVVNAGPSVNFDAAPSGGPGFGYASTGAAGPAFVDIRAGKGDQAAVLRVAQRREGANCIVDWELVTSG